MEPSEIKQKTKQPPVAALIAPWSLALGWLIMIIYWTLAFSLAGVIREYFLSSKVERDAAEAGSLLATTLDKIQTTSAVLEPLKFVGITFIIVGISLTLVAIVQTLKLRAATTAAVLEAKRR